MLTETPIKLKGRREELGPMPKPLPNGSHRPLVNILIIKDPAPSNNTVHQNLKS
ncbi:hypothetical protein MM239_20710 [Belliella sp. DSM 111904]|uniref:Uncharacterized protein n=1 Tax=Belliella filtrata TaxID=2923435 RepID=A0ABS9V790_9BACT|nr:hypothetical protein [Belliella filtrata]MCH7411820.1 hypothetical protein [Belliella filtrata]